MERLRASVPPVVAAEIFQGAAHDADPPVIPASSPSVSHYIASGPPVYITDGAVVCCPRNNSATVARGWMTRRQDQTQMRHAIQKRCTGLQDQTSSPAVCCLHHHDVFAIDS